MSAELYYDQVKYWVDHYGRADAPDQRTVQDYVESETDERIHVFQAQLHAISKGRYDEQWMDQIVGGDRRVKHLSYERWAELMLLWLASYNRKA